MPYHYVQFVCFGCFLVVACSLYFHYFIVCFVLLVLSSLSFLYQLVVSGLLSYFLPKYQFKAGFCAVWFFCASSTLCALSIWWVVFCIFGGSKNWPYKSDPLFGGRVGVDFVGALR